MEKQILKIYRFLVSNRNFPLALQTKHREANLVSFTTIPEKVFSLLHDTYYTQSQPKLDKAKLFFEKVFNEKDCLSSFHQFSNFLGNYNVKTPYQSLFEGLGNQPGWGDKTSALFVKNIYYLHHLPQMSHLRFWNDVPSLTEGDRLYLPVDAVIKDIMGRFDKTLNSFWGINEHLANYGSMDIWDDLWFWGFFTQKGSKSPRVLEFNTGKYWLDLSTSKDKKTIEEIEQKCIEFITLLPKS